MLRPAGLISRLRGCDLDHGNLSAKLHYKLKWGPLRAEIGLLAGRGDRQSAEILSNSLASRCDGTGQHQGLDGGLFDALLSQGDMGIRR